MTEPLNLARLLENSTQGKLDLHGQHITDNNVHTIVSHFLNNKNLTAIDLSDNDLSDKCIKQINELLSVSHQLENLNISSNNFSQEAITSLSNYIQSNTHLIKSNVDTDKLDASTKDKIEHALQVHEKITSGIAFEDNAALKEEFIDTYWQPFLDKLDSLVSMVIERTNKGFDLAKRLPSQKTLLILQEQCWQLTELWYGKNKGNLSVIYSFFHTICESAHLTCYRLEDIKLELSEDGYYYNIDSGQRKIAIELYQQKIKDPYLKQGGQINYGRTAIEDLTLSNIMKSQDAQKLLYLSYIKKVIVSMVVLEQKNILDKLKLDLKNDIKIEFKKQSASKLKQLDIKTDTFAYSFLEQQGVLLEDWGQLPQQFKEAVANEILNSVSDNVFSSEPDYAELYSDFCEHIAKKPGEYYKNLDLLKKHIPGVEKLTTDKDIHEFVQTIGSLSGELTVIKRTKMEEYNIHRYLAFSWDREFDLNYFNEDKKFLPLRNKGTSEQLRVRINQMPYKNKHCISLASSGYPEGFIEYDSEDYNWSIPIDELAIISNQPKDIEKIVREFVILNPNKFSKKLPTEINIDIHQNIHSESSIIESQHMHLSNAVTDDFPLFNLTQTGTWNEYLGAYVNFVDFNEDKEAYFLKIKTRNPDNNNLLSWLIRVWDNLQQHYQEEGGDLYFHISAGNDDYANIIFMPVAKIERLEEGGFKNVATTKTITTVYLYNNIAGKKIKTKGEGYAKLKEQIKFLHNPGSRKIINKMLAEIL